MKRKEDLLLQSVGGRDILIPIGSRVAATNGIVVLNEAARLIWELLAEDRTLADLVSAIVERFDIDEDRARADVAAFLDELQRQDWIEA
jgi:hypothetical protein